MKELDRYILEKIKFVVFDVDGTLTDGSLYYSKNGLELKKFNVKDGLAITLLRFLDVKTIFLTSENSEIIDARAKKLKIDYVIQNTHNKLVDLKILLDEINADILDVLYIGDDINDLEAISEVGFSACPIDASDFIKDAVNYISPIAGGNGAVRDIIEQLMIAKNTDISQVYIESKLKINQ